MRTERGPVDTQRRFFAILAVGVLQVESRRNSEIDLVGGYCEFPPDSAQTWTSILGP